MRRLVPFLIATLLLTVPAVGAAATHGRPRIVATKWTAHQRGERVYGKVVVVNRGRVESEPGQQVEVEVRWTADEGDGKPVRMAPDIHLALLPRLPPGAHRTIRFSAAIPSEAPAGRLPLVVCAFDCRRIGWVTVTVAAKPGAPAPSGPGPSPSPPQGTPASTVPTAPIGYEAGKPFVHRGGGVEYWAYVPRSYDATNQTPSTLFVWLHGCEGEAGGDIWNVDPEAGGEGKQDWLTLALAGREEPGNECWVPGTDAASVLAAVADFETHFNVDRRRVILGGYSSGGDLAYRTAYEHAALFAGLLIENSAPFRDTGLTPAQAIGDASRPFPVVQLAHTGDETYGIEEVRSEIETLRGAGFPVTLIERPGRHYDSHTDADLRNLLLPHIDDGWLAPGP